MDPLVFWVAFALAIIGLTLFADPSRLLPDTRRYSNVPQDESDSKNKDKEGKGAKARPPQRRPKRKQHALKQHAKAVKPVAVAAVKSAGEIAAAVTTSSAYAAVADATTSVPAAAVSADPSVSIAGNSAKPAVKTAAVPATTETSRSDTATSTAQTTGERASTFGKEQPEKSLEVVSTSAPATERARVNGQKPTAKKAQSSVVSSVKNSVNPVQSSSEPGKSTRKRKGSKARAEAAVSGSSTGAQSADIHPFAKPVSTAASASALSSVLSAAEGKAASRRAHRRSSGFAIFEAEKTAEYTSMSASDDDVAQRVVAAWSALTNDERRQYSTKAKASPDEPKAEVKQRAAVTNAPAIKNSFAVQQVSNNTRSNKSDESSWRPRAEVPASASSEDKWSTVDVNSIIAQHRVDLDALRADLNSRDKENELLKLQVHELKNFNNALQSQKDELSKRKDFEAAELKRQLLQAQVAAQQTNVVSGSKTWDRPAPVESRPTDIDLFALPAGVDSEAGSKAEPTLGAGKSGTDQSDPLKAAEAALAEAHETLRKREDELAAANRDLEASQKATASQAELRETSAGEAREAQAALERLNALYKSVLTELETARDKNATSESQYASLQRELAEARDDLSKEQRRAEDLGKQLQEALANVSELQAHAAAQPNVAQKESNERAEAALAVAQTEVIELRKLLHDEQATRSALSTEIEIERATASAANKSVEELKVSLDKEQQASAANSRKVTETETLLEDVRRKLEASELALGAERKARHALAIETSDGSDQETKRMRNDSNTLASPNISTDAIKDLLDSARETRDALTAAEALG